MSEEDIVLTPMMKQFLDLKAKHPDAVMLFRCGDFYETYSTDAVVAAEILGIQYIIIDGNTGSYQFRNTPLHQFLGHLRVFQLVTDGYTFPGTYQFRQIRIQGMMRESRHFNSLSFTIGTLSQGNSQDFSCTFAY